MEVITPHPLPTRPRAFPGCANVSTDNALPKTIRANVDPCPADSSEGIFDPESRRAVDHRIAVAPTLRLGDRILGFTLIEHLGKGGFAEVFLAEQDAIAGRRVVLKIANRSVQFAVVVRLDHPRFIPTRPHSRART